MGVVAQWISSGEEGDDGCGGGTSEADDVVGPLLSGMKEGGGKRGGGGSTIIGGRVLSTAEVVHWRRAASLVINSIADLIDWRRSDCDCEGRGRMAPNVVVESRGVPPDVGEEGNGELAGANWDCRPVEPTLNSPIGEVGTGGAVGVADDIDVSA